MNLNIIIDLYCVLNDEYDVLVNLSFLIVVILRVKFQKVSMVIIVAGLNRIRTNRSFSRIISSRKTNLSII